MQKTLQEIQVEQELLSQRVDSLAAQISESFRRIEHMQKELTRVQADMNIFQECPKDMETFQTKIITYMQEWEGYIKGELSALRAMLSNVINGDIQPSEGMMGLILEQINSFRRDLDEIKQKMS